VLAVGHKAWDTAALVPLSGRNRSLPRGAPVEGRPLEFHGFQVAKSGFQVFNANTEKKAFMLEGKYPSINNTDDPDGVLAKTDWLTERYFIVPLGRTIERCLVCDFGGHNYEK
jgi:hypothetical protein